MEAGGKFFGTVYGSHATSFHVETPASGQSTTGLPRGLARAVVRAAMMDEQAMAEATYRRKEKERKVKKKKKKKRDMWQEERRELREKEVSSNCKEKKYRRRDELDCHVAPPGWTKIDFNYSLITKVCQFQTFFTI